MRDALAAIQHWKQCGSRFALAIVVKTWGSSPRPVGSVMAIREDGFVIGSVSGGCVEGAVISEAVAAIKRGEAKALEFGAISDEEFWAVGLSCGGEIGVLVLPSTAMDEGVWAEVVEEQSAGQPWAVSIQLGESHPVQKIHPEGALLEEGFFVLYHPLPDRLIIVGAVHVAISLVKFAHELGFQTILIDPRATLANADRFPVPPHEMIVAWPQDAFRDMKFGGNAYAAILTHDPKIDDVALSILLRSDIAYIGALGGRVTQGKRKQQLADAGFNPEEIARIHGPIGLDIGALTPEEIALSIMSEIVKVRAASR